MFSLGKEIKINQGFDCYTIGEVISFDDTTPNRMGHVGNYQIKITGGLDCFGKPAKIGKIVTVLKSHVSDIGEDY